MAVLSHRYPYFWNSRFISYFLSFPELLNGKDVAVFGSGDDASYPDEFCAAIDIIRDKAIEEGLTLSLKI